jgi:hypothetical protein
MLTARIKLLNGEKVTTQWLYARRDILSLHRFQSIQLFENLLDFCCFRLLNLARMILQFVFQLYCRRSKS